jgi:hypothetical protein
LLPRRGRRRRRGRERIGRSRLRLQPIGASLQFLSLMTGAMSPFTFGVRATLSATVARAPYVNGLSPRSATTRKYYAVRQVPLPAAPADTTSDVEEDMSSIFHSFAKYRRFWMAILMVLSMVTFVLCTGIKGDVGETFLRIFQRRGGDAVFTVDGTTFYKPDVEHLKQQREAADKYMREFARLLIETAHEQQKSIADKQDEEAQQIRGALEEFKVHLLHRLNDRHFFGTGTKLDELVDFQAWLAEADRLEIRLEPKAYEEMSYGDLYRRQIMFLVEKIGGQQQAMQINMKLEHEAISKLREFSSTSNMMTMLKNGLDNEYRVQLAQLALAEVQFRTLNPRLLRHVRPIPDIPSELSRLALSPEQLWQFYQDNRTEYHVALLPIAVETFVKDVAAPDQKALEKLFEDRKTALYDPVSPDPGFRKPHLAKVAWVQGDPASPFFKSVARVANVLAAYPIGELTPQLPLATGVRMAAGPAVFDARLAMEYRGDNQPLIRSMLPNLPLGASYLQDNIGMPMATWLAGREPLSHAMALAAAARPDAVFAAPAAVAALGAAKHPEELNAGIREEVRRRAPIYATLVASGAAGNVLPAAELDLIGRDPVTLLPLAVVRNAVKDLVERRQAGPWVSDNILFLKKKLEEENVVAKASQVHRLLERFGPNYNKVAEGKDKNRNLGLELHKTKEFFDRYAVENDPELKPVRDSFKQYFEQINLIEGRGELSGKPKLKEDDFWKLFFDGSESWSLAGGQYVARPWPPTVATPSGSQLSAMLNNPKNMGQFQGNEWLVAQLTRNRDAARPEPVNLIASAEKPILFWKTDDRPGGVPANLAEVQDKVLGAWKFLQARENKALPYAQKVAESLMKGNAAYGAALAEAGKDIKATPIELRMAKLMNEGQMSLVPFKLRGEVKYARDDAAEQLLALHDLKEPIKIGVPEIDRVNEELFRLGSNNKIAPDKFVQILTNKPRDTFFVAAIDTRLPVAAGTFVNFVLPHAAEGGDLIFDIAQVKRGEEHYRALVQQIRQQHKVKVENEKALESDAN